MPRKLVVQLVEKYRQEGAKAVSFFELIKPEEWDRLVYSDRAPWLVRDVLAHIVDAESGQVFLVKNISGGGSGVSKGFDIDEYNAKGIAARKSQSPEELIKEFQVQRKNMIIAISGLSEEDMEIVGQAPHLGEVSLAVMLRMFYLHINVHIRDIRRVLG